ncbi:MAG TPA: lipid-binding SYLF domain-containing protein [Opitutaceae bacterium]|nr:lipid-binding SYLF domain-containing protein [Opitutaceae bacterium]
MKKALSFALIALFAAAGAARAVAADRATCVTHVESCEAILQEFMREPSTAIPPAVWKQAKAVMILNQFKAGFLFGVKAGYGVIMARQSDGRWSVPVLISASEASIGLQLGAKSVETVCIITDARTPRLLFNQRFNIGVDAKAVAGPVATGVEQNDGAIAKAPILVYTKSAGLFAGATVKAGYVDRDDQANFVLYGTTYTLPELLYSNWVTPAPEVLPLMHLVQRLAP